MACEYNKSCPKRVRNFLERLEAEIDSVFFRYAESSRIDGWMYPAYWYGEQQTKTFVTLALGNLCAGSVMQEPSLSRGMPDGVDRGGRADYYCKFGNLGFLLEVKQKWVGNGRKSAISAEGALAAHNKVVEQVTGVKNTGWEANFALGITLAPLYANLASQKAPPLVDKERIRNATNAFFKSKDVHAVSYFETRGNGDPIVEWDSTRGKNRQHYPGVFLLWYIREL